MTLTEQATGEWLDRLLEGLSGEARRKRLKQLARQISLTFKRASSILTRYRYELRFRERHCEVSRKFGVSEAKMDPRRLSEMLDEQMVQQMTGWGNGGVSEPVCGEETADGAPDLSTSLAGAAGVLLDYLQPALLKQTLVWKFSRWRKIFAGETVEVKKGAGTLVVSETGNLVSWLTCAVVIMHEDRVVDVFPEARIVRRAKRKSGATALCLFALDITGEQLNREELCRRFAAMLRLYRGSESGVTSQVHLARLAGVTKQAVNDMQLRMKQQYHRATGGRAAFEKVSGKGPRPRKS